MLFNDGIGTVVGAGGFVTSCTAAVVGVVWRMTTGGFGSGLGCCCWGGGRGGGGCCRTTIWMLPADVWIVL